MAKKVESKKNTKNTSKKKSSNKKLLPKKDISLTQLLENVTNKNIPEVKKEPPHFDYKLRIFELERKRIQITAQASVYVFFIYILIGFIGIIKGIFSIQEFFTLLIISLSVLLIANYPFLKVLKKETDYLEQTYGKKE